MDKNVQQATATAKLEKQAGSEVGRHPYEDISISFVINARGRALLIHNRPFGAVPVWIKYLTAERKIQLIFDNGSHYTIDYVLNDKRHKILLNLTKILIVRTEDGKPVEGYDTNIIRE